MTVNAKTFGTITESGGSSWINTSNINDSDDNTYAEVSANHVADKLTFSAPGSVSGIITAVVLRVRVAGAGTTVTNPGCDVLIKSGSTTLVDLTGAGTCLGNTTAGFGEHWINIPPPSVGEWTHADYDALTVEIHQHGTTGTLFVACMELTVLTHAYRWPIMEGIGSSLAAASARAISSPASNDSPWSTSVVQQEVISPIDLVIRAMNIVLATSPGGAGSETIKLNHPVAASSNNWGGAAVSGQQSQYVNMDLGLTISGATTTIGDDGKVTFPSKAGFLFRKDRTLSGSISNASATQRMRHYLYADKFPLFARTNGTVGTSSTAYLGVQDTTGAATSSAARASVMPVAGTIANLVVMPTNSSSLNGSGYTITLEKSTDGGTTWTPTALTLTITSGTPLLPAYDNSHSVTFNAGDMLHWKVVGNGNSTALSWAIGATFVADDDPAIGILCNANLGAQGSTTTYNNWHGGSAWDGTESNVQALGAHCEVIALAVQLGSVPGAGKSRTVTFRKGGADTAATVTISGGVGSPTAASWSGSVAVEEDDLVCVAMVPSSSPNSNIVQCSLAYRSVEYSRTKSPDNVGVFDSGRTTTQSAFQRTPSDAMGIADNWPPTARGFTSSSATATTVKVNGAGWTTNQWAGKYVRFETGPNSNDAQLIVSNTSDTITVAGWIGTPTAGGGDKFAIVDSLLSSYYYVGASVPIDHSQSLSNNVSMTDYAYHNPRRLPPEPLGMTDGGIAVKRRKGDVTNITDEVQLLLDGSVPRSDQSQILTF